MIVNVPHIQQQIGHRRPSLIQIFIGSCIKSKRIHDFHHTVGSGGSEQPHCIEPIPCIFIDHFSICQFASVKSTIIQSVHCLFHIFRTGKKLRYADLSDIIKPQHCRHTQLRYSYCTKGRHMPFPVSFVKAHHKQNEAVKQHQHSRRAVYAVIQRGFRPFPADEKQPHTHETAEDHLPVFYTIPVLHYLKEHAKQHKTEQK